MKKFFSMLLTISLMIGCMSGLCIKEVNARRYYDIWNDCQQNKCEYIEFWVNGELKETIQGEYGNVAWLFAGVYKVNELTVDGDTLIYSIGNQSGTWEIPIPGDYENYVVHECRAVYGGGDNTQEDLYDFAVIHITINEVVDEELVADSDVLVKDTIYKAPVFYDLPKVFLGAWNVVDDEDDKKDDLMESNYEAMGEPFGPLDSFEDEYTEYVTDDVDTLTATVSIPADGDYTFSFMLREYRDRGYDISFTKVGETEVVASATTVNNITQVAQYELETSKINMGVSQSTVTLEEGLYTMTLTRVNGTHICGFKFEDAVEPIPTEEPTEEPTTYTFDLSTDKGNNCDIADETNSVVITLTENTNCWYDQAYDVKSGNVMTVTFEGEGTYKDTTVAMTMHNSRGAEGTFAIYDSADMTTLLATAEVVADGTNPIPLTFDAVGGKTYVVTGAPIDWFLINKVEVTTTGTLKAVSTEAPTETPTEEPTEAPVEEPEEPSYVEMLIPNDTPVGNGISGEIVCDYRYLYGYSDTIVGASEAITREEVAALINRILLQNNARGDYRKPGTSSYSDLSTEWWSHSALEYMTEIGVYNSEMDEIMWWQPATRWEVAKLVAVSFGLEPSDDDSNFNFVDKDDYYCQKYYSYIKAMVDNGYYRGYGDKTLKVNDAMTRAEFVTMFNRIIKRTAEYGYDMDNLYETVDEPNMYSDLDEDDPNVGWAYLDILNASYSFTDGKVDLEKSMDRTTLDYEEFAEE